MLRLLQCLTILFLVARDDSEQFDLALVTLNGLFL